MVKFELPVASGNVDDSNGKELVISSYQGNLVRAPYDGIVKDIDINHCDGYLKIEHLIDDKTYYSSFCGVNRITVNRGDSVRKGHSIGIIGDKEIKYSILTDFGGKVNVKPFFDGIDNDSKKSTEPNKEPKSDNSNEKDPTADIGLSNNGKGQDIFSAIGLAPFNLVDKLLGKNFKPIPLENESVMEDEVLQEELKRIKKLL
jgi:hypothetical protein